MHDRFFESDQNSPEIDSSSQVQLGKESRLTHNRKKHVRNHLMVRFEALGLSYMALDNDSAALPASTSRKDQSFKDTLTLCVSVMAFSVPEP